MTATADLDLSQRLHSLEARGKVSAMSISVLKTVGGWITCPPT